MALKVLQPEPGSRRQDCSTCRNRDNCWASGIKEEHIMTNLLVCRLKRGIEMNRSTRMLLSMLRPKLRALARFAVRETHLNVDMVVTELESATIEALLKNYVMGEIAYPLHYLFGHPNGVIRHYANNYVKKVRRYEDTHVIVANLAEQVTDTYEAFVDEEDDTTRRTRIAREVIDDGITLNAIEYRVLKFCLTNATEARRPLNGLHVHLAKTMGVVRARVTKIYADALRKVNAAVEEKMNGIPI
jgi:hypothetical protein